MKKFTTFSILVLFMLALFPSCMQECAEERENTRAGIIPQGEEFQALPGENMQQKLDEFAKVKLTADFSHLTEKEKEMLPDFFKIAKIMNGLFWKQAIGQKEDFLNRIQGEDAEKFALIQYGPWNRLNNNKPFLTNIGKKPAGANFYPADMTKEEFEELEDTAKTSLYTLIRRDGEGKLIVVWYQDAYKSELKKAADLLNKTAGIAEDEYLKNYLSLRAEALLTSDYQASDFAWMDMKNTNIDFVVGPIENYEDQLFGYKAAFESFILIKDPEWSKRLQKFAALLPDLQKEIPVDDKYKKEIPGSNSDLNVYDAIYYAGDCNAGSKTIAINLPNDPEVHLKKGSRKLQLKNAMKAKFDKILVPISEMLIDENQRQYIKFSAFFENTMFHEVAHGMGIKNTINDKGTAREALKETYSSIEEGKADILGLWLVTKLRETGELTEGELKDNFVTFFASIFRSSRFGTASAHGKANMMRFNFFEEYGAFNRNENGTYTINFEKMQEAMNILVDKIMTIQGDGNYQAAKKWVDEKGKLMPQLKADLERLNKSGIPVDIVFEQGIEVCGLK